MLSRAPTRLSRTPANTGNDEARITRIARTTDRFHWRRIPPPPHLLIVTGLDVFWFPAASVATAVIVCWPLGSEPVTHQSLYVHVVVPVQFTLPNCTPLP